VTDSAAAATALATGVKVNNGVVMVFFGSNEGLLPATCSQLSQSDMGGEEESGDRFGWTLASGDFNGNGNDDLAVGAPYEDYPGGIFGAGAVYIWEN